MNEVTETILHPFAPVVDERSRVLILGSMPSPASRRQGFYYGHPQNRFWQVLACIFQAPLPCSVEEKQSFLRQRHLALWDVAKVCRIQGAADSTLVPLQIQDFSFLFAQAPIEAVFTNGRMASRLYQQHVALKEKLEDHCLPSTSAANARYRLPELCRHWRPVAETVATFSDMV